MWQWVRRVQHPASAVTRVMHCIAAREYGEEMQSLELPTGLRKVSRYPEKAFSLLKVPTSYSTIDK